MNDEHKQYIVNNELMDREHRVLIDILVRLNDGKDVTFIIFDLLKYSNEHFAHEEELMTSSDYPMNESHTKQHRWFVARILRVIESKTYNAADVRSFLYMWLLNHINVCDRDLAEYIKSRSENERTS